MFMTLNDYFSTVPSPDSFSKLNFASIMVLHFSNARAKEMIFFTDFIMQNWDEIFCLEHLSYYEHISCFKSKQNKLRDLEIDLPFIKKCFMQVEETSAAILKLFNTMKEYTDLIPKNTLYKYGLTDDQEQDRIFYGQIDLYLTQLKTYENTGYRLLKKHATIFFWR